MHQLPEEKQSFGPSENPKKEIYIVVQRYGFDAMHNASPSLP